MSDSVISRKLQSSLVVLMTVLTFSVGLIVPSVESGVDAATANYPPYFKKLEKGLFYPAYLERDSAHHQAAGALR